MFPPDPLALDRPLPLTATFHPLGHALELATDSPQILAAAGAVWSRYPRLSAAKPVRLDIAVAHVQSTLPFHAPVARGREHLVWFAQGTANTAVADLARGFAFAHLAEDVAADADWVAYHFIEPLGYMLLSRHVTILHAACIAIGDRALLLSGESSAGKTCLSYACAKRGWAFLSGDACQFTRNHLGVIIGRPFSLRFRESARQLFPELNRYTPSNRLTGKLDIAPPVDDLPIRTAHQAEAVSIVFLSRDSAASAASLKPVPAGEAFRRLAQTIFVGDACLRAEQRASLEDFIRGRQALELTWSGFDEAERLLRQLLQ